MTTSEFPELSIEDKQLIDDYLADMEFRELSPVTIKMTRYNITKYAREVGIRSDKVIELRRKFQHWLMRESLQPQTRALWMTAVHCFYKWANAEGHFQRVEAPNGALVDFDPTIGMTRPKSRKGTPHPIEEEDLSNALEFADARMKCWLLIGAMCGGRCKEIAGVRREDIQETTCPACNGTGTVADERNEQVECENCIGRGTTLNLHLEFTKGNKPRDVPMDSEVLDALNEYGMPESGFLWGDVDAEDVSRGINAFLHDLGIKSTAHKLRHRYGTVTYRALGGDSFLTAELMGHSDPAITTTYAAPDRSKVTAILGKLRVKAATESTDAA